MRSLTAVLMAVVVLFCGQVTSAHAEPEDPVSVDTEAVDSFVTEYLDRHGLAGAGVAVVKDGRVLHTAGYGEGRGGPVSSSTPLAIGSVSKPFTAFAVLQLVAAGKIELDAPVVSYLPELKIGDDRASRITVRHLLSHTSGLPDPVIVPPAESIAEDLSQLQDWQLRADPGTEYAYSNYNSRIAARLVEVVSRTPFATYLEREVFEPLGMTSTRSVTTTRDDEPALNAGHVTAYGLALPAQEMAVMVAGAGGVISTAEDMAQWLAMQTDGGRTPDGQALPQALLAESHSPQPGGERAGLGWSLSSDGIEPARVSHSGSLQRFNAQMDLVPSSGYGVVVMLNSFTPTMEHAYEISSGIIEITEGGEPAPGAPAATLIDAALGLLTLLVLGLTVLGLRRSERWAARRSAWPTWRYALRLLPSMVFPALGGYVFLVLPRLQDNSATTTDALLLWPAGMLLLLALAVSGLLLTAARTLGRVRRLPRTSDHAAAAVGT
jgi:CubicO group peptidase (beta-lactamase class C family)